VAADIDFLSLQIWLHVVDSNAAEFCE